jgi:hypothetical protein
MMLGEDLNEVLFMILVAAASKGQSLMLGRIPLRNWFMILVAAAECPTPF